MEALKAIKIIGNQNVFISSKYRVTKGFKFHARPQTGAYSWLFCCFVLFVATLSDFGLLFFLIEAFVELRKMLSRKKLYHARFGNCSTPKQVPRFCRFTKFTKMQLT